MQQNRYQRLFKLCSHFYKLVNNANINFDNVRQSISNIFSIARYFKTASFEIQSFIANLCSTKSDNLVNNFVKSKNNEMINELIYVANDLTYIVNTMTGSSFVELPQNKTASDNNLVDYNVLRRYSINILHKEFYIKKTFDYSFEDIDEKERISTLNSLIIDLSFVASEYKQISDFFEIPEVKDRFNTIEMYLKNTDPEDLLINYTALEQELGQKLINNLTSTKR